MVLIRSQNCPRESGSTPVVGSSRMSRSGSWINAQHRLSFCFMPPESLPAGLALERVEARRFEQFIDATPPLGFGLAK
jgi:hypothetical protein